MSHRTASALLGALIVLGGVAAPVASGGSSPPRRATLDGSGPQGTGFAAAIQRETATRWCTRITTRWTGNVHGSRVTYEWSPERDCGTIKRESIAASPSRTTG